MYPNSPRSSFGQRSWQLKDSVTHLSVQPLHGDISLVTGSGLLIVFHLFKPSASAFSWLRSFPELPTHAFRVICVPNRTRTMPIVLLYKQLNFRPNFNYFHLQPSTAYSRTQGASAPFRLTTTDSTQPLQGGFHPSSRQDTLLNVERQNRTESL